MPGINDIIKGGYEFTDREGNTYIEPSFAEKKAMGTAAVTALADYQTAKESGDTQAMAQAEAVLEQNFDYGPGRGSAGAEFRLLRLSLCGGA